MIVTRRANRVWERGTEMGIPEVLRVGTVFVVLFWAFWLRRRNAVMQLEVVC